MGIMVASEEEEGINGESVSVGCVGTRGGNGGSS